MIAILREGHLCYFGVRLDHTNQNFAQNGKILAGIGERADGAGEVTSDRGIR